MLLDLSLRFVINPSLYEGTLAIRLETDNRPECGVFAGEHAAFPAEENHRAMPRFHQVLEPNQEAEGQSSPIDLAELGFYDFVVDRPESRAQLNQVLRYHYVVVGWTNGVYIQHQSVWTLTLCEFFSGWHVSISRPGWMGLDLVLPDYQPGWIQRTGAQALRAT
jgi:hypothetical protein